MSYTVASLGVLRTLCTYVILHFQTPSHIISSGAVKRKKAGLGRNAAMIAGRSKQTRRTPHSSSGNIHTPLHLPVDAQYSPQFQGNNEYTHHGAHSNLSLQSLTSAAGVSAQERIVKSLVDKLIAKVGPHLPPLRKML